jgi:hypothetical protein
MFCSTVIPTIGRPELARAVQSVLDQVFEADDFEVIVVNDSGRPLSEASWQQSARVQIIDTNRHERCVARNAGAAIAKGKYLHFLDDDDWLLPGALEAWWRLAQENDQAGWLYGVAQLVDRAGQPIIQLHPNFKDNCFTQAMAGEWIPLQTSLIKVDTFFARGGFTPLIPGAEDIDLARQIAFKSDFAYTQVVVACIGMGVEQSSTNYVLSHTYARWARERILDQGGVFTRLRASTGSGYWRGRMLRLYLTSIVWNLQHGQVFKAASRAAFGLMSLMLVGSHLFSVDFWRAVVRQYDSKTFLRGFQEANRPVERRS